MNISLTSELEEFVRKQVASGHYSSASEVVRDALRQQIRAAMDSNLTTQLERSRQAFAEGQVVEADDAYFADKIEAIRNRSRRT